MKTTNQFALAALLVIGATLGTSSPLTAQTTITLTNVADPTDQDSYAAGQATLSELTNSWSVRSGNYATGLDIYYLCIRQLTVRCSGLTPRATYQIGPTWNGPMINKKGGISWVTDYTLAKASNTGTLELSVYVTFLCGEEYWYDWLPAGGWHDESYGFSIDRKQGKGYIDVFRGFFPWP